MDFQLRIQYALYAGVKKTLLVVDLRVAILHMHSESLSDEATTSNKSFRLTHVILNGVMTLVNLQIIMA